MIYYFLRPIARLACLIYFRKIFLLNVEAVPRKGPLLLVCNHPSSFFEACLLAVMLPRSLYFLTRGDFFKNTLFTWFLRQTHQIPIFRAKDGFDKLRNNQDTFAYCYQALKEEKAILIFPESWTILEKRLRPLQKGAARLALGSLNYIPSLNILPIGITFSNPMQFRSHVTVHVGQLIPATPPETPEEERNAVARITEKIEVAFRTLMINIDQSEREPLFDAVQMLAFNRADVPAFPIVSSADDFPREEMRIASRINNFTAEAVHQLGLKIKTYFDELSSYQLKDRFSGTMSGSLGAKVISLMTWPLFIAGKMAFALPAWLINAFLKTKLTNLPFLGPVKWIMGFFGLTFWFLLCLLIAYSFAGMWGLIIALVWLMCGFVTLLYFHDLPVTGWLAPWKLNRKKVTALQTMRNAITENV